MKSRGCFSLFCELAAEICFGERNQTGVDYNEAGLKVLTHRLHLSANEINFSKKYQHLNIIWKCKETNAKVYVGDHHAAENKNMLLKEGITKIVNCTRPSASHTGELPNYLEECEQFTYFEFPVGDWNEQSCGQGRAQSVIGFFKPMLAFVENALMKGENILVRNIYFLSWYLLLIFLFYSKVHCLAGAHRAGTTGIALLMYFASKTSLFKFIMQSFGD